VHARAREEGVTVLLDGNGLDEGWAGYEYYARAAEIDPSTGPVQGSRSAPTRPDCLIPEFAAQARAFILKSRFPDPLSNLQYRDVRHAKIPRAMRFADRVSMMYSRELREPFLDHRLLELGLRQPRERKIRGSQGKWLPRRLAEMLLPAGIPQTPKRPVQTPQREWLRAPLAGWATQCIEAALAGWAKEWLDANATRRAWQEYQCGQADHSFPVWQWISLGLLTSKGSPE
jgi:asparagine synthase (glutamine-hydrolysing)